MNKEVTILLIEDDEVDAIGIIRSFNKHRIANNIIRARHGAEAIQRLDSGEIPAPFIILLDINMPTMGGLEFLTHLREHPQYKDVVVFILTSSDDESDILAGYKSHIAGYFVKNETGENFQKVVEMLDGYWKIVHLP